MPAPYPTPQNISGLADMGIYANTLTGGLWGVGILVTGMVVLFAVIATKYSTRAAIATSSTTMMVLSILWRFAGQINDNIMYGFVLASMGAIMYLYFTRDEYGE